MIDRYFVDTNILVYCRDTTESAKHQTARDWIARLWATQTGRISTQVLKEYYQVVTRRLQPGLTREEARSDIRDLQTWEPLDLTSTTFELAWIVEERIQLSWWDSLVIASAQQSDCRYLLSEDLQHEQSIENLTILNPFESTINEP